MSVPGPLLGPCDSWITGDDVAECCSEDPGSEGAAAFDDVAIIASMVVFELSGRQFPGVCEQTVRPCSDPCNCWGLALPEHYGVPYPFMWNDSYGWRNECGDRCGCGHLSRVKLSGYPVTEILEVKIDGAVVAASGYRLDEWRWLTRLDEAGPPVVHHRWPACQNLALPDTAEGTFSVRYSWGVDPPQLGRDAAAQLACELWRACNGGACQLPTNVTKIVREGVTIDRTNSIAAALRAGASGLVNLDTFLAAYNPYGHTRAAALFSPDVQQFARRVGS